MHFSKALVATLLAGFAVAQETSSMEGEDATATTTGGDAPSGTSESAPEGSVMVHVITVGSANGSLTFSPDNLKANVGDMVQFQFYPKNHSVVQADFGATPEDGCKPKPEGMYSGFMPVAQSDTEMPVYTIEVKDDKPIWYYCSQGNHCQGGMVGVINQADGQEEKTLEKWKEACAGAQENISPDASAAGTGSTGEDDTSGSDDSSSDDSSSDGSSTDSGPTTLTTSTPTSAGEAGAQETSNSTVTGAASSTFTSATKSSIAVFLAAVVSALLL